MVRILTEFDHCRDFINEINADPDYFDPMLQTEEQMENNLKSALTSRDQVPLGVFSGDAMTGLFVFLILKDDRYIEMLVGLSREPDAYEEIADWLQTHYSGYQVDFVFNPKNRAIRPMLQKRGATFFSEQIKMVLTENDVFADTAGIERLSGQYRDQYVAIHSTDGYWTGEKVVNALDTFDVFLAVEDGRVVGYIDVTRNNEENEPFDLLVRETSRRRGWGRKLLAKAIEANRPKGMMLIVDANNAPAIELYRSMGFSYDPEPVNQLATWMIAYGSMADSEPTSGDGFPIAEDGGAREK